jgi:hypothetical protein
MSRCRDFAAILRLVLSVEGEVGAAEILRLVLSVER